jgi:hypothetical protein
VSTGGTVTATQWSTLASTITSAYQHISGTDPSVASPSAGSTISIISNLSTAVTYITSNQYSQYNLGTSISNFVNGPAKGSANSAWTMTFTQSITFSNSSQRDYFFYAGGLVFLQFSKSSTGLPNDAEWNTFATAVNQISLSSTSTAKNINSTTYNGTNKQGGSGTPSTLATTIGYAQLTGSNQTIFQQYNSAYPYSGNYIQVQAQLITNGVQFTSTWYNAAQPTSSENQSITAGGTQYIVAYYPSTTYITNTWGTATLASSVA